MLGQTADPIAGTVEGGDGLGTNERRFIGRLHGQIGHVFFFSGTNTTVTPYPFDDPVRLAALSRVGFQDKAASVARKEAKVNPPPDRFQAVVELPPRPIFVMPHREEGLAAEHAIERSIHIFIGAVGHVITVLFQPEGEGELEEEELTGTEGQGVVRDLPVAGVRPVEADADS